MAGETRWWPKPEPNTRGINEESFPDKPEVHTDICRGLAGQGNCARGHCTIALAAEYSTLGTTKKNQKILFDMFWGCDILLTTNPPSLCPLGHAQIWWVFAFQAKVGGMKYPKIPLSFDEQADLLLKRGLVADRVRLVDCLANVRNRSLQKSTRYRDEKPKPDSSKREELEETSRRFSVKYLLAVMNSTVARDFLHANRRSNIHLYPDDWKKLPLPNATPEQQVPIIALVDLILTKRHANPSTDISVLEHEVDGYICRMYGLERK